MNYQEVSLVPGVVDLPLLDEATEALMYRLPEGVEAVGPAEWGHPVPLPLDRLAQQLHVHRLLGQLKPASIRVTLALLHGIARWLH